MRLFVAAELPDSLFEAMSETSALLRDTVKGRYTSPDLFHVTLAFLGEVGEARVGTLQDILDRVALNHHPFEVRLTGLGYFGKPQKATLWQGVEAVPAEARGGGADGRGGAGKPRRGKTDPLSYLANDVRGGLELAGFEFDQKGFRAHVTLMRDADLSSGELPMPHIARGELTTVTLFKSKLSPSGPSYFPLYSVELG